MSTAMQNGRASTEVVTPPVAADQGAIPHGDSAKDSAAPSNGQRHSLDAVGVGITRFLAAFRESLATDAEPELADAFPHLCRRGCGRPVFYNGECATCPTEEWPTC